MKLQIGYMTVLVGPIDRTYARAENLAGLWDDGQHLILIDPSLPAAEQAATLIHEIIHACWSAFQLPDKRLDQEAVCCTLERPLATVLRDNPTLPGVLHQALVNGRPIVT